MSTGAESRLQRGQLLLLQQHRPELAEPELRAALAANPNDPFAHSLLAMCLRDLKRLPEATTEATSAIHLAPDMAFTHYVLATVMHVRNRLDEALTSILEALRLDPREPDFYSRLAAIRHDQGRWQLALTAAEEGLAIDAEHVACNNLRAMALVKLGRGDEAGATIANALARDPENAITHANQGWTLLHGGDAQRASVHFREALRLDPNSRWARDGIVEALKARNPLYALLLRYSLWMSRLDPRAQWAVLVVGFLGFRLLGGLARTSFAAGVLVWPLIIAYVVFAVLTWVGDPIFTLLLRLDRFGRLVVTDEDRMRSNLVGGALLAAVLGFGALLARGNLNYAVVAAVALAAQTIPLASIHRVGGGWPRRAMTGFATVLATLAVAGTVWLIATPQRDDGLGLLGLAIVGALASTWGSNILAMVTVKR